MLRLDLGTSFKDGRPVAEKLASAVPVTLELNLISLGLIYLVAIPTGAYAAVRRNRAFDQVSSVVLFVLYSMPSFWVRVIGFST